MCVCLMRRLTRLIWPTTMTVPVGRIRRSRRIRQLSGMPDATLNASYLAYNDDGSRRPDKAFTPHPAAVPECLNGSRRPDKAFTPHPAAVPECLMRRLTRLIRPCIISVGYRTPPAPATTGLMPRKNQSCHTDGCAQQTPVTIATTLSAFFAASC